VARLKFLSTGVQLSFGVLLVTFMNAGLGRAQTRQAYPTVAPLGQYLMDRSAEIALAPKRSSRCHIPQRRNPSSGAA